MLILIGQCALAEGTQANNRTGWFVGAGGGNGEVEVVGHNRSSQLQEALTKQGYQADSVVAGEDDNTDPWMLVAGYKFSPYWQLKLAITIWGIHREISMPM